MTFDTPHPAELNEFRLRDFAGQTLTMPLHLGVTFDLEVLV